MAYLPISVCQEVRGITNLPTPLLQQTMPSGERAQMEQAFHRAFRLHLTSRPSDQMTDLIRESPLPTQNEFVDEFMRVSSC